MVGGGGGGGEGARTVATTFLDAWPPVSSHHIAPQLYGVADLAAHSQRLAVLCLLHNLSSLPRPPGHPHSICRR